MGAIEHTIILSELFKEIIGEYIAFIFVAQQAAHQLKYHQAFL